MKLFTPKRVSAGKVGQVKLSSHLVKPAKFASSKVSIKAPRSSGRTSRLSKIKI